MRTGFKGGNRLKTVANPLTGGNAVLTYTYDEWGRQIGRSIDSNNSQSLVFDSLGRISSLTNPLCPSGSAFSYTYFDPTHPTGRLGAVGYPNGQSTAYNYYGNTGDERLQEIKNLTPAGAVLSQNDYTYDAVGKIVTWQQQTGSNTPLLWTEGYDVADQLTSASLANTAIPTPAIAQDTYAYDPVGNRTSAQLSGVTRTETHNSLNQLTASTVTGNQTLHFSGAVNGSDTVTVNGNAATVSGGNFNGPVTLAPGTTNTVTVAAQDSLGNSRTNKYQIILPLQPSYSPTYDADGNQLSDGTGRTYTWDAKNELISINYTGGNKSSFSYDALGRRIGIVETGSAPSTKQFVWDGPVLAEERDGGNSVTKRFFNQGEQIGGVSYFLTRDHLGSVREMTDSSGTIQARYSYDPYGQTTKISGSMDADFGYAGMYMHLPTGLNLTLYRAFDPSTARWLSRDPMGEAGGINLYGYVDNDPVDYSDPQGLAKIPAPQGPPPVPAPNGGDWTNSPDPGNSRGGSWTAPGGASGSWDPDGHWDVDPGTGERERYDWRGNPISPDQAHNPSRPPCPTNNPNPKKYTPAPPYNPPVIPNIPPAKIPWPLIFAIPFPGNPVYGGA